MFSISSYYISVCLSLSLSQNGQTPLMLAAEQGSLEIVQELIRRGANVNLDDVVRECSQCTFKSHQTIIIYRSK